MLKRLSLAVLLTATYGCSAAGTPGAVEHPLDRRSVDGIDVPDVVPRPATVMLGNRNHGESMVVAFEWPDPANSTTEVWYSDAASGWPERTRWAPALRLVVPTQVLPATIERWFFREDSRGVDGVPVGEPEAHSLCVVATDGCVTELEQMEVPIDEPPGGGLLIVQLEWLTPPTRGQLPTVARVSYAIAFAD